jgi:hypothetical protein
MGACWQIESEDEFFDALNKIKKNKSYRPYTNENVKKYLNAAIYNEDEDSDILGDYANFLSSNLKQ